MTEVTQELMYELMKRMQADLSQVKDSVRELRQDNISIRGQINIMQGDITNLRGSVAHIEDRLDRIENRLELRELAEAAQTRFEPRP